MIFIGGYMHSGTTLLLKILGQNSKITACPFETKFMEQAPHIESAIKDQTEKNELIFKITKGGWEDAWNSRRSKISGDDLPTKILESKGTVYDVFVECMNLLKEKEHVKEIVEKTPSNVYFVDDILRNLPKSKIILIHRNPLQVIASKKLRASDESFLRYDKSKIAKKKFEMGYNVFLDSMSWKKAARQIINHSKNELVKVISYDALVENPNAVIKELCLWLKIEFEYNMLSIKKSNSADREKTKKEGIFKDSLERYKKVLTKREVQFITQFSSSEMAALNYRLTNSTEKIILLPFYINGVAALIKRGYNRFRFMSFSNFLIFAKNYLRRR